MGTVMMMFVGFGWAKPVPVNLHAVQRRTPAGIMLVSLAGPLSNMLMAVFGAIFIRGGWVPYFAPSGEVLPSLSYVIHEFVWVNIALMLFNLIPVFPLDGEKIIYYFLAPAGQRLLDQIRPYGKLILLAMVFLGPRLSVDILGGILYGPLNDLYRTLLPVQFPPLLP